MNKPEMIPCDHVIARLWEYIDGELTEESAAKVRAHLDVCSRCFPQYDFQRAYKEFARRSAKQPMPLELRRRVFEAILEEAGASASPRWGPEIMARIGASLTRIFRNMR